MKILFLTDNYPPEVNAPAARTHFHCAEWVKAGADVTVITCTPNFPQGRVYAGYKNQLLQRETIDGVTVIRVWSFIAPNKGAAKRILDYVSFACSGILAGLFQSFDVVVATSPQFFTAVAGAVISKIKGKPWVFELRDLWPESIVATGAMKEGFLIDSLERLETALYRSADLIVPVTQSFRDHLGSRGIQARKVQVVTNGVDKSAFHEPRRCYIEGRPFRVGYLGTHGLAHALDLVLRTATLFDANEVEFVLVGDGADKERLVREATNLKLANVCFRDPVSRDEVPRVLQSFDVSLVPLRDSPTFESVIPSKIFEAAAAGLPVLLGVRGEARELVERYGAGLAFRPEDEHALAERIRCVLQSPELYAELQEGAERLAGDFDRVTLASDMLGHLTKLVPGGGDHLTPHIQQQEVEQ